MSARNDTQALMHRLAVRGVALSFDDANTLRRAQITLHRWGEMECGDSNAWGSWMIERNEETGIPYMVRDSYRAYQCGGTVRPNTTRTRIADREAGALRRVAEVCKRNGAHFFHQTDPRGCALYVAAEVLTDQNYSSAGVACCN